MDNLSSSIFYILTGWACAINIYKFFYSKKLKKLSKNTDSENIDQLNHMKSHHKKAQILGSIFLALWCISAVWYFYSFNV